MNIIRKVTIKEIEQHLKMLGSGNHLDNMDKVKKFAHFYDVELSEEDFHYLVFLYNKEVAAFVDVHDRSLIHTAENAIKKIDEGYKGISGNWRPIKIENKFIEKYRDNNIQLPHLILKDAREGERNSPNGRWYLQDGNHRALGYMISLLRTQNDYKQQKSFIATNEVLG